MKMKKLIFALALNSICLWFGVSNVCAQEVSFNPLDIPECVVYLKNAAQVETENGFVSTWGNMAGTNYNAVQEDDGKRPVYEYEPVNWPGIHTIKQDDGQGRYLTIENSEDIDFSNGMTVFYVGRVSLEDKQAPTSSQYFIGNWANDEKGSRMFSGWSLGVTKIFTLSAWLGTPTRYCLKFGKYDYKNDKRPIAISAQYSNRNMVLHQSKDDEVKSYSLDRELDFSNRPLSLNGMPNENGWIKIAEDNEIASVLIYNRDLSGEEHQRIWDWIKKKYPSAFVTGFALQEKFWADNNLPVDGKIQIDFNKKLDAQTGFPSVFKNSVDQNPVEGKWAVSSNGKSLEFTPAAHFEPGSWICVDLGHGVVIADEGDVPYINSAARYANYIVATTQQFGMKQTTIESMKIVQQVEGVDHTIPLEIAVPTHLETGEQLEKPTPVVFWVHGGGWSGGTLEGSHSALGTAHAYLVQNVGVAVIGTAYRCKGSLGTFAQAMEDIEDAVKWARANAEEYNLDLSRIGFSGGSAGAPLSALQAQRTPETLLYVGFNGVYDFVNNKGFGGGNAYGQQNPSAEANSAAYNLKSPPPHTIVMHGSADTTISPDQSVRFAEAVRRAGGTSKCVIYEGEVHSFLPGQMKNACLWEFKEGCIQAFNLTGHD